MPGAVDFAVNQQAEQIVFEVEPDGHIVAHVLIRYAGDPAQFAWLVPVPSAPELSLSYSELFGLIDAQTEPRIAVSEQNICPAPLYYCMSHPMPYCPGVGDFGGGAGMFASPGSAAGGMGGAGGTGGGGFVDAPPVTVISREQIGSYETIVFAANDAQGAVDWLQTEGFIVNDTTSPYMEPYVADEMLFVAAKLVPGADADEIRPLRMRFEGTEPMIPLQLTAVATEPNLTVTAYIYGSTGFVPQDQTLLRSDDIPSNALSASLANGAYRDNYPMVLARLFDEEGGRAFMLEYSSLPPRFEPTPLPPGVFGGAAADCCAAADTGFDTCSILNDGECQCPLSVSDEPDCMDQQNLVSAVRLLDELAAKYPQMTRITTRLSAEEMTFDPMFEADPELGLAPRLALIANVSTLSGCEQAVIEDAELEALDAVQGCASVYCGRGTCAGTASGAGCVCEAGFVARTYTDLDGAPSVTCVRDEAPVDLAAGGLVIPDICGTLSSDDSGACVNLAGFAGMRCDANEAAVLTASGVAPSCLAVTHDSGLSGALDYSAGYKDLRICAPPPPTCDARFGWLERNTVTQRASVERCASSEADPSWLEVPPKPTCEMIDDILGNPGAGGAGGASGGTAGTNGGIFVPSNTAEERPVLSNGGGDSDGCRVGRGALRGLLAPAVLSLLWLALRRKRGQQVAR